MWHTHGEVHTGFWWRNMKERGQLEDLGMEGRIIIKCLLGRWDEKAWTGFIWVRIETSGGLL
jgi:hypothetical protein